MLNDLRLPAINQDWSGFADRADDESSPAARLLAVMAEHEIAERDRRLGAGYLAEAQLLPGKTLTGSTSTSTSCRWSPRR
jgi:hypothetical protein